MFAALSAAVAAPAYYFWYRRGQAPAVVAPPPPSGPASSSPPPSNDDNDNSQKKPPSKPKPLTTRRQRLLTVVNPNTFKIKGEVFNEAYPKGLHIEKGVTLPLLERPSKGLHSRRARHSMPRRVEALKLETSDKFERGEFTLTGEHEISGQLVFEDGISVGFSVSLDDLYHPRFDTDHAPKGFAWCHAYDVDAASKTVDLYFELVPDLAQDQEPPSVPQGLVMATKPSAPIKSRVYSPREFPELDAKQYDLVSRTSNSGVCFSGGGTRAMIAGMGQMRALYKLDLMNKIRYQACVSGGNWASTANTFRDEALASDDEFLGAFVNGDQEITLERLQKVSEKSLGYSSLRKKWFMATLIRRMAVSSEFWNKTVCERFLEPYGIDIEAPFTYSEKTREEIIGRNPSLKTEAFQIPRKNHPFLVINSAVMTPYKFTAIEASNLQNQYNMFESTPLTVGMPIDRKKVTYKADPYNPFGKKKGDAITYGGMVEPVGYNSSRPSSKFDTDDAFIESRVAELYCLRNACGTSSTAYGGTVAIFLPTYSPTSKYWPVPYEKHTDFDAYSGEKWVIVDGGLHDNFGLISLLRRKVENIVVLVNTSDDIPTTPLTEDNILTSIDVVLCAFFGYDTPVSTKSGECYQKLQVFEKKELLPLAKKLQKAMLDDEPVVVQMDDLLVIGNEGKGVEGGWKANVTWVYLAKNPDLSEKNRNKGFNKKVNDEVFEAMQDEESFPNFPNYATIGQQSISIGPYSLPTNLVALDPEEINLLADYTCWTLHEFLTRVRPDVRARFNKVAE